VTGLLLRAEGVQIGETIENGMPTHVLSKSPVNSIEPSFSAPIIESQPLLEGDDAVIEESHDYYQGVIQVPN
jgi:hypothetical protein